VEIGAQGRESESFPGTHRSRGVTTRGKGSPECTTRTAADGWAGATCGAHGTAGERDNIRWSNGQNQEEKSKKPTDTATGARPKETSPTAKAGGKAGGEVPSALEPPRRKRTQCPVFGCTRKHAPDNCPTFRDMVPKERLDLIHQKQLCLFCLGKECWTMGKWPNCTIDGCGKPHHEMLHEVLKAGKPSVPAKKTEPPSVPPAAAGGAPTPTAYLK
jgi:hypothetical protein